MKYLLFAFFPAARKTTASRLLSDLFSAQRVESKCSLLKAFLSSMSQLNFKHQTKA